MRNMWSGSKSLFGSELDRGFVIQLVRGTDMVEVVDRFLQQFPDRNGGSREVVGPQELLEPAKYALDHGIVSGRGDPGHALCHAVLFQEIRVAGGGELRSLVAVQDELGPGRPFPGQQSPQRQQDEVHAFLRSYVPFQDLVIEQIQEADEGILRFAVLEVGNIRSNTGEGHIRLELPIQYIGEDSVRLAGGGPALSAELCLDGQPPHGPQNAGSTDDPARFCFQAPSQRPIAETGVGLVERTDVLIQYRLGYLVAVLCSPAAEPFVIAAAGVTEQLTKQRNRVWQMQFRYLPVEVLLYFFGGRHLLSRSTPFFSLAISTLAFASSYSSCST